MDDAKTLQNINRVAIIGAGNAGITAAKLLIAEAAFSHIDVFEQRSEAGGLWIYNPANDVEDEFSIPQTTARAQLERPIWRDSAYNSTRDEGTVSARVGNEPTFISPLYESLESNLPKQLMQHSDLDFPLDSQLFPTHECVKEYLGRYADDVRHLIRFENQVQDLQRRTDSNGRTVWTLTSCNLVSSESSTSTYDAVVIASGHFMTPYIPDIPGIRQWNDAYPNSVSHSKHFRRPEEFSDKKVIAIGRGFSGLDIASRLMSYVKKPLILSTYQPGQSDTEAGYIQLPEIAEFLPPSSEQPRAVRFIDGHIESNIDHILFCTGYMYCFPYLPSLTSTPPEPPTKASAAETEYPPIITDGSRPRNLYQYVFYNADPTLAVMGMPQQIVPFPVAEAQAAVVARAWAGRLDLPGRREMERWEAEAVEARGDGKKWLWLKPPLDGRYLNELSEWAGTARPRPHAAKDSNPPHWGEREFWIRQHIVDIRKAFLARGADRGRVRTIEELGFDLDGWKAERRQNGEGHGS